MTLGRASAKVAHRGSAQRRAALCHAWLGAIALLSMCAPSGALGASGHSRASAQPTAPCAGTARRVRARHVRISFTCEEDVTWFEISANRALRAFEEPEAAYGCERASSRSFRCEDIHSGTTAEGIGIATVAEPLCPRGARLVLRIKPAFDFEQPTGLQFTLRGPC